MLHLLDPCHFETMFISSLVGYQGVLARTVSYEQELMDSIQLIPGLQLPPSMEKAVGSRKLEYLLGRLICADLMTEMGRLPVFVDRDDRRPIWPEGLIGSISHTDRVVCCALADAGQIRGIGLDCETVMASNRFQRISSHILSEDDQTFVEGLEGWKQGKLGTLIFSAKESLYKCLNPLVGVFFGFQDASLISIEEKKIKLKLNKNLANLFFQEQVFSISYEFIDELVFTSLVLEK